MTEAIEQQSNVFRFLSTDVVPRLHNVHNVEMGRARNRSPKARLCALTGRHDEAVSWFGQAFESIGMNGWLRRADELAAQLKGD